jgi:hypothetical protein
MFRLGGIIGLAVGALLGYLASSDIDTSLGAFKVPVYIGMGALFGWMSGMVFHMSRPREPAAVSRDQDADLTAATKRAAVAAAEVQRLRERVAELEPRG